MAETTKKKDRGQWFREMKSELKKVIWPDKKTVMKNTGTVLLCSLLIGVCIWVFVFVAVSAVQMLIGGGGSGPWKTRSGMSSIPIPAMRTP